MDNLFFTESNKRMFSSFEEGVKAEMCGKYKIDYYPKNGTRPYRLWKTVDEVLFFETLIDAQLWALTN